MHGMCSCQYCWWYRFTRLPVLGKVKVDLDVFDNVLNDPASSLDGVGDSNLVSIVAGSIWGLDSDTLFISYTFPTYDL